MPASRRHITPPDSLFKLPPNRNGGAWRTGVPACCALIRFDTDDAVPAATFMLLPCRGAFGPAVEIELGRAEAGVASRRSTIVRA